MKRGYICFQPENGFSCLCLNVSTTPLQQQGFLQCLPFSWTTLRGKHCWHPIVVMGVADTFGLCPQVSPFLLQALHCADIHSGKKGSSTLRNAPFFLKTYCNSTLYVLAVRNYIVLCRFADVYHYICLPFQDDNCISTLQEKEKKKERKKNRKESKLLQPCSCPR